jgi:5-methylcytosine-specific restriction endonuclease McrA
MLKPVLINMLSLNRNVLVLNQNYEPISICNVKKAIILVYLGKAEIVESLDFDVRAISFSIPFPSVVRLQVYVYRPYTPVILSRKNIIKRDNHTCQYCGKSHTQLTVDHIVPKQYGGKDSWENLVCACVRCNCKKGNRTPEKAGMKLLKIPKKPSRLFFLQFYIDQPHENWRPYLFLN